MYDWIQSPTLDNVQMKLFRAVFLAQGRGRRPTLPDHQTTLTKLTLLQLAALRHEAGRSWDAVSSWVQQLSRLYPSRSARYLVQRTVEEAEKCADEQSFHTLLTEVCDLDCIGPFCGEVGITRSFLSEPHILDDDVARKITKGAILELASLYTNLPNIMSLLTPIPPIKWKNIIAAVKQAHGRLKKHKKIDHKVTAFLSAKVIQPESLQPVTPKTDSVNVTNNTGDVKHADRVMNEKDSIINDLNTSVKYLREVLAERAKQITVCSDDVSNAESRFKKSESRVKVLEGELVKLSAELECAKDEKNVCKGTVAYKQLKRREKYLREKERRVNQKLSDYHTVASQKSCKVAVQNQLSVYKKRCAVYSCDKLAAVKELRQAKLRCVELEAELLSYSDSKMETRSGGLNGQSFTEDMEKCVMVLVGELDVPTNKCATVIQSVSKWLFHKSLSSQDLPCTTTVTSMADRAHFLSKIQVGEMLLESERWDLHGDGTARNNKKIVGQQVTLGCGTSLSVGFNHVATEDSQTLLDNAIAMMDELAEVVDPANKESVYKSLLTKMFALMSDRSSVNKSFNDKFVSYRNAALGSASDVHFLYCNAHFLLGMSNVAEQVLKKFVTSLEEGLGSRIGRDAHSQFSRFNSSGESGPARFIRTGCDVLGPRGDEKNGCLSDWEAYCSGQGEKSRVTSFRMNRFNNFFEGAGALYFHREHLVDFLANYKDGRNLKLDSVYCDALSEHVLACVRALGLVYHKISGPFWRMLQSNVNYADLHLHVQRMHQCLQEWIVDPAALLDVSCRGIFPDFFEVDCVHESLCVTGQAHASVTLDLLQYLITGFVAVIQRQLNDFLPDGRYGQQASTELRESMAHCKVTNLLSEYEFGDLDYSQFRRRHASLYFHSGVQMCRKNRTISKWLASKCEKEQGVLLRRARKNAGEFRKKQISHEKKVLEQIKSKLSDTHRKKEEKDAKAVLSKQSLIACVHRQKGPCHNSADVDRLLRACSNESSKKESLKNEIRYLKVILSIKDQRLVFGTKSSADLARDLKSVLANSGDILGSVEDIEFKNESAVAGCGKRKLDETENATPIAKKLKLHSFSYQRQGGWVCVAYDTGIFVGMVIEVKSPEVGIIQFLQRTANGSFRWPSVDDVADVEHTFVISSDFEVLSGNGRVWEVPEMSYLEELYKEYATLYFLNDVGDDDL